MFAIHLRKFTIHIKLCCISLGINHKSSYNRTKINFIDFENIIHVTNIYICLNSKITMLSKLPLLLVLIPNKIPNKSTILLPLFVKHQKGDQTQLRTCEKGMR